MELRTGRVVHKTHKMSKQSATEERGDAPTSQEHPEMDLKALILQLQQTLQKENQTLQLTLQNEIKQTHQTITDTQNTLQNEIKQTRVETQRNFEDMNNKMDGQEKQLQEMLENFKKETRSDLDYVHARIEETNVRMEEAINQVEEKNQKNIEEAIDPIQKEIQLMRENNQRFTPDRENIQVVINPEMFRTETEQKFYGDGRTNPKVFLKNLKTQVETMGRNVNFDLKKYLRGKFLGDAELWYDIIVEEFETFEDFETTFKQYYWGQQTQAKVRENLYNGRYNETFGTSRERYAMRKISNARQLEPPMMERDIIQHVARHFEEEICDVVIIHEISSIDRFLTYLRRIDDAKQHRRYKRNYNTQQNNNRWVAGSTPQNIRGESARNAPYTNQNSDRWGAERATYNNNNRGDKTNNINNNQNTQEGNPDKNKENYTRNYNNPDRRYNGNRFYEGRRQENEQERKYWDNRKYNGNMTRNSRDSSRDNSRSNSRNCSRERKRETEETRKDPGEKTQTPKDKQIHFNDIAIIHTNDNKSDFQ